MRLLKRSWSVKTRAVRRYVVSSFSPHICSKNIRTCRARFARFKRLGFPKKYNLRAKILPINEMTMWGPDKDWQCFRCYSTHPPSQMSLNRETKKWYCATCIDPEVISTPYILTKEQTEAISLYCQRCDAVFITQFKSKLEGDKSSFICQRCKRKGE